MFAVAIREEVSLDDDENVRGVELFIDDRTVADTGTYTQIAFDQGREFGKNAAGVDVLLRDDVHVDISALHCARPNCFGGEVVVIEVG